MKRDRIAQTLSLLTCLVLVAATVIFASGRSSEGAASHLRSATQASVQRDDPVSRGAGCTQAAELQGLLAFGNSIPISEVPQETVDRFVYWMKTVVKKEWLPQDVVSQLVAVRDFGGGGSADSERVPLSPEVGDYIIARYQVDRYLIAIQDSGASLAVLVTLPAVIDLGSDPEGIVRDWIETLVNLPSGEPDLSASELRQGDGLYGGRVGVAVDDLTTYLPGGEMMLNRLWWQDLAVCTDGSYVFMSVWELDGSPVNPQAQPGLPERF